MATTARGRWFGLISRPPQSDLRKDSDGLPMVRRRVVVSGSVQQVGFRMACTRRAIELGLTGSVRNLDDGTVQAVFQGPQVKVDQMISWCRTGPRLATVRSVDVSDEPLVDADVFEIVS
jgi:acylphosphatase